MVHPLVILPIRAWSCVVIKAGFVRKATVCEGWVHYGVEGKLDPRDVHIDLWPDVSEYKISYPTSFLNRMELRLAFSVLG